MNNNSKKEESITISSSIALKGTLTLPTETKGPYPVVIFLHGSGPTDRDENVKGMNFNIFKDLSDSIIPLQIATFRYDKRGVGESEGNYLEAGMWDFIDDAVAAIKFLKNHPKIDSKKIFILGHSEGAVIAPIVNNRENISGLILLAGTAESTKDTIKRQSDSIFNEIDQAKGLKGLLFRLLKISNRGRKKYNLLYEKVEASDEPVLKFQGQQVNAKWMREHFQYNVMDDIKKISCPVLAVTGSKDLQVLPDHAQVIAETAGEEAEYHIIKDMTHILRKQQKPASMLTLKNDYKKQLSEPIDSELLEIIQTWLKKQIEKNS